MAVRSNTSGFNLLATRIREMSAEFQQEVKEITEYHLGEIELEAIRNAPGPGALVGTQHGPENERDIVNNRGWTPISQAIGYTVDSSGFKGSVYVEQSAGSVAAWIEFGTGQSARSYLATVPADWKAIAQKYYINGKGTILAQPYLLPAFLKHKLLYVKDLEDALKNLRL